MTTPTTAGGAVLPATLRRYADAIEDDLVAGMLVVVGGNSDCAGPVMRDAAATIEALSAELAALKAAQDDQARDAGRYRKLRRQDWFASPLAVVVNPKGCVKPGSDCPSRDRLDAMIDAIEETP